MNSLGMERRKQSSTVFNPKPKALTVEVSLEPPPTTPLGGLISPLEPDGGFAGLEGSLTTPDGGTIPDGSLDNVLPTIGNLWFPLGGAILETSPALGRVGVRLEGATMLEALTVEMAEGNTETGACNGT
jgi:hypothetical protein